MGIPIPGPIPHASSAPEYIRKAQEYMEELYEDIGYSDNV